MTLQPGPITDADLWAVADLLYVNLAYKVAEAARRRALLDRCSQPRCSPQRRRADRHRAPSKPGVAVLRLGNQDQLRRAGHRRYTRRPCVRALPGSLLREA